MDKIVLSKEVYDILGLVNDLELINSLTGLYGLNISDTIKYSPSRIKFYKNHEFLAINLYYMKEQNQWYLDIAFNPNKVYEKLKCLDFPVDLLTQEEFQEIMDYIHSFLFQFTNKVLIHDMKIKEYHVCIDIVTNYPYENYHHIYKNLKSPGKFKMKKGFLEDSEYSISKFKKIVVYNKSEEFWGDSNYEEFITRIEYRHKIKLDRVTLRVFDYIGTLRGSVNIINKCIQLKPTVDIDELIIRKLNDDNVTINKSLSELKDYLFIRFIKEFNHNNNLDSIKDIISKDLSKSERERLSILNRELKNNIILRSSELGLLEELKIKLNRTKEYVDTKL